MVKNDVVIDSVAQKQLFETQLYLDDDDDDDDKHMLQRYNSSQT